MKIFALALALVLGTGAPVALALGVEGVTIGIYEGPNGDATPEDIEFLRHAAVVAMGVVDIGELAMKRGNSPNALTLGRQAQQQYTPVVDNLLRWARHKGMGELFRTLDPEEFALVKKLKAASSDDFDLQFLAALVQTQAKLAEMFRKASGDAHDVDIKGYAKVELPNLEGYMKNAEGIANEMRSASK